MPCVVQWQLFEPHSQTWHWWFPWPGAGAVNNPHCLYTPTPEGRLPSCWCLHYITLPVCSAPCLCMSTPIWSSLCSHWRSQLHPFCLCKSACEGSTSLMFMSAFTAAPLPAPCLCTPTPKGLTVFVPAFIAGFPQFCTSTLVKVMGSERRMRDGWMRAQGLWDKQSRGLKACKRGFENTGVNEYIWLCNRPFYLVTIMLLCQQ